MISDLRGFCRLGAWLLLALCLIAGVERHIAEAMIDDVPPGSNLLNTETVDGEEMTIHLVAVAKTEVPTVDEPRILVAGSVPSGVPERLLPFAVRGASPRAPPRPSSSTLESRPSMH